MNINDLKEEIEKKEEELTETLLKNGSTLSLGDHHFWKGDVKELAHMAVFNYEFFKSQDLQLPETHRKFGCGLCGKRVPVFLKPGEKIIRLNEEEDNVSPCAGKALMSKPLEFEIKCPSGELIFANDFRRNDHGTKIFKENNADINAILGKLEYSMKFASQGLGMVFVGNSSPNVYRVSNDKILIGSIEQYDPAGYICTDLWWVSFMDRNTFEEKMKMSIDEYEKKGSRDILRVSVEPGVYKVSSRYHLEHDKEYEEPITYAEIERLDLEC